MTYTHADRSWWSENRRGKLGKGGVAFDGNHRPAILFWPYLSNFLRKAITRIYKSSSCGKTFQDGGLHSITEQSNPR